jgi:hypothetical protein
MEPKLESVHKIRAHLGGGVSDLLRSLVKYNRNIVGLFVTKGERGVKNLEKLRTYFVHAP